MSINQVTKKKLTTRLHAFLWFIILCALILTSWYCRPLLPFQELQIASTTWEMWQTQTYWIPINNGEINPQMPPLLNWIELAVWFVFGPNEVSLRLTTAMLSFGTLLLTAFAARQLWPSDLKVRKLAPLILIGSFVWILFATAHINQILLSFFQILCVNFLIRIWRYHAIWWIGFSLSFLCGLLSSGAGFVLYIIPLALSYPFWDAISASKKIINIAEGLSGVAFKSHDQSKDTVQNNTNNRSTVKQWYLLLLCSSIVALFFFVLWAYVAYLRNSDANMSHLLGFSQLFYRINDPMPLGFYLLTLPFILFPWALWPPIYRDFKKMIFSSEIKFCIFWILSLLAITAVIGTNPTTPLLPAYPVLAILIAKTAQFETARKSDIWPIMCISLASGIFLAILPLLAKLHQLPEWIVDVSPLWGIGLIFFSVILYWQARSTRLQTLTLMSLALVISINFGVIRQSSLYYDLAPASNVLSELEKKGFTLVHLGRYQSQFHFPGRLTRPLKIIDTQYNLNQMYADGSLALESKNKNKKLLDNNELDNFKIIFYPSELNDDIKKYSDYYQPFRGTFLVVMPLDKFKLINHFKLIN